MMYSAMLLASLLASAHGFAAIGSRETFATELDCFEYALGYCRYPTCDSNDDCQGTLQCEFLATSGGECKLPEWPFCPQVHDGAGGIRYEVECS